MDGQSSTTSKPGCGWRATLTAIGIAAFAVAALFGISILTNSIHKLTVRTQWRQLRATITDCSVKQLKRPRMQGKFFWKISCAAKFPLDGKTETGGFDSLPAYYEHRIQWWGNPGIDELRAWTAQHPAGSTVVVRSDPEWPPTLELDPTPEIFDYWSNRLTGRIAAIAAIAGAALIALVFGIPR